MNIIKRAAAPTPRFFRDIRTIGLVLAAIGGGIMTSQAELPKLIAEAGGYMTLIGGIISAMSQITVDETQTGKDKSEISLKPETDE